MELQVIDFADMSEEIKIKVGKRIRAIRNKKGLTQVQLQTLTGISQGNIYKYETGKRSPSLETLEKIARALRVDIKDLL